MKAEKKAASDNIAAVPPPTTYTDINAITVEGEIPCRTASNLNFISANGIFTNVSKRAISVIILGMQVEVIEFNLRLNPVHVLNPNAAAPGCNNDGVTFLPAKSTNVLSVAGPFYARDANNKVTNVVLFFQRINKIQPATLGARVKFEENMGSTGSFNPKRKAGTISFP